MKISDLTKPFIILLAIFICGCSINRVINKGDVENAEFHYSVQFSTAKSIVLVPVEIDGSLKNFIFDTGANLSLIQRDTVFGKTMEVTGASKRKVELGREAIKSLRIGDINFRNTNALHGDFVGLKEQIPDFGGILGQPIIKKANWLIDYPLRKLEISDRSLIDSSFQKVNIVIENGLPYTFITIEGQRYKALIDLGSTASLSIPPDLPLAKYLLDKYSFKENEREVYTMGGLQKVKENIGIIPEVKIGNISFDTVHTDIRKSSRLRLGMRFFEECILYIDNQEGDYKIKI